MKPPLLFSIFLMVLFSCQPQVNTTITARFINPEIDSNDMILAKKQIESRLGKIKAMNSKVDLDATNKTILFQGANKVSPELTRKFNSLFKKSKFELRHTINVKRSDLSELIASLPEMEGFKNSDASKLSLESSVLGYVHGEKNQKNVLSVLNNHFSPIKDLKVMVMKSASLNDDRYQLHLVNIGDGENLITQSNITGAGSFKSELDGTLQVKISLNHRGAKKIAQITTIASRNNKSTVALLFNDQLLSAPHVQSPITSGILTIAYNGEEEEIVELGDILSMGPLSYDLEVVQ